MAAFSVYLQRAMIRGARLANPADPKAALNSIISARFTSEAADGKTIISTTKDGLSVSFGLAADLSPVQVMELAEKCLSWLEDQAAEDVIGTKLPRAIRRLRVSFAKATN